MVESPVKNKISTPFGDFMIIKLIATDHSRLEYGRLPHVKKKLLCIDEALKLFSGGSSRCS
jgi:hypothetical protein